MPVLNISVKHFTEGELNMSFLPQFKSKYRVNQIQKEIENWCIIKNFKEKTISDFKWLVMTFKINPQIEVQLASKDL